MCECLVRQYSMYVYLMYHCITTVQCSSSSTIAVHYATYYCNTDAVFAVCAYIARPPSLACRRSPAVASVSCTPLYAAAAPGTFTTVPYLHYVLLLYYRCCICCVHIHYSPAVARPPPPARRRFCWLYTGIHSSCTRFY